MPSLLVQNLIEKCQKTSALDQMNLSRSQVQEQINSYLNNSEYDPNDLEYLCNKEKVSDLNITMDKLEEYYRTVRSQLNEELTKSRNETSNYHVSKQRPAASPRKERPKTLDSGKSDKQDVGSKIISQRYDVQTKRDVPSGSRTDSGLAYRGNNRSL